jgi:hypothetical protein
VQVDRCIVPGRVRNEHDLPVGSIIDEPLDCCLVIDDGEDDIARMRISLCTINNGEVTVLESLTID